MRYRPVVFCLVILVLGGAPLSVVRGEEALPQEQALVLKRIAEFWKDGDFAMAKRQILDFLGRYGQSSATDPLYAMLGDLYFHEKNYKESCASYKKLRSLEFQSKTLLSHAKALFELKEYAALEALVAPMCEGHAAEEEICFLYAEALFKLASEPSEAGRKEQLLQKAKSHYERLSDPRFTDFALLPRAEIHRQLNDFAKVSDLYQLLAQKFPSQQEDFLFQAATAAAQVNKTEAIKLFRTVYEKQGTHAAAAAFNQMVLLFESAAYLEVVERCSATLKDFSPDHFGGGRFYVGMSLYELKHFKEGASYLDEFALSEKEPTAQLRVALLSLIACARELNDAQLCERSVQRFAAHFASDPEYSKVLLIHAHMALEAGHLEVSQRDLETLIDHFPDCAEREEILYEHAMLLMHNKRWTEARAELLCFLAQYPTTQKSSSAREQVLLCTLQDKESPTYKEHLVADLTALFTPSQGISGETRSNYLFLLGKTLFDLRRYDKALETLSTFVLETPRHSKAASAHLLQALAIEQLSADFSLFAEHIQTALSLDPSLESTPFLHIELFNAYLQLAKRGEGRLAFLDKAADQLFSALKTGYEEVKIDNLLWLANHYYAKASAASKERALFAFEKLLNRKEATVALEPETLKYAALLVELGGLNRGIAILEDLLVVQAANPHLSWKFQRHALLQLAKLYEEARFPDKALRACEEILSSPALLPSYLQNGALLQKSRLRFSLLSDDARRDDNPQVVDILSCLKDLQIRKKLACEPLHLEAALEYAAIRTALSPAATRNERAVFYLKRILEDFRSQEDALSKEYHAAQAKYPDKEKLLQSYLQFIEAEILRLAALDARQNHLAELALQQEREATRRLQSLENVSELKARVRKSLEALAQ